MPAWADDRRRWLDTTPRWADENPGTWTILRTCERVVVLRVWTITTRSLGNMRARGDRRRRIKRGSTYNQLMREARNPQGSTPSFRGASVVRFETCAHRARMWQPKNLTRRCLQPTDARLGSRPVRHRRVHPGGAMILHYLAANNTNFPSPPGLSRWNGDFALQPGSSRWNGDSARHATLSRGNPVAPAKPRRKNLAQDHQTPADKVSSAGALPCGVLPSHVRLASVTKPTPGRSDRDKDCR